MCTYETSVMPVRGSGKGASGWFQLTEASVYLDHSSHTSAEHTLNIDLLNPAMGASARIAMELDPSSARALANTILSLLARTVPPEGFEPTLEPF